MNSQLDASSTSNCDSTKCACEPLNGCGLRSCAWRKSSASLGLRAVAASLMMSSQKDAAVERGRRIVRERGGVEVAGWPPGRSELLRGLCSPVPGSDGCVLAAYALHAES